jgi:hypothetical protein
MTHSSMQSQKRDRLAEHIRNLENARDMKEVTALLC